MTQGGGHTASLSLLVYAPNHRPSHDVTFGFDLKRSAVVACNFVATQFLLTVSAEVCSHFGRNALVLFVAQWCHGVLRNGYIFLPEVLEVSAVSEWRFCSLASVNHGQPMGGKMAKSVSFYEIIR